MGAAILYGVSGKDKYAALVDRSITDFVMPKGITVIGTSVLQGCTNLLNADITGAEEVRQSGMSGCTNIKTLVAGTPLKSIGNGAFYYVGDQEATLNFDIELSDNGCTIGDNAFRSSKVRDVIGKVTGTTFGNNTFFGCTNIRVIDFRKGTITQVGSAAFRNAENGRIFLPNTVSLLGGYSFNSYKNGGVFFYSTAAPTAISTDLASTTNVKWYVPYNSINAYRTATNWTVIASGINGFAAEGTFQPNDLLPTTNGEGLTLTWYLDEDLTMPITNAPSNTNIILFCTAS